MAEIQVNYLAICPRCLVAVNETDPMTAKGLSSVHANLAGKRHVCTPNNITTKLVVDLKLPDSILDEITGLLIADINTNGAVSRTLTAPGLVCVSKGLGDDANFVNMRQWATLEYSQGLKVTTPSFLFVRNGDLLVLTRQQKHGATMVPGFIRMLSIVQLAPSAKQTWSKGVYDKISEENWKLLNELHGAIYGSAV